MGRKLTSAQAADELGITPARIRQFVMRNQLKAEKFGRDLVIDEDDLQTLKDRKTGRPPKATPATAAKKVAPKNGKKPARKRAAK